MSLSSHQDVSFVDWLHASAINNEESDGSTDEISQSSQSTTMDLASPFRLHYVYPPSDVDLASSPNSPYHRYSYFPTSALPAVFLNHRMDSIDSNATLLATPSPKSLRFSSVSSDITPRYSTNSPFYVNSDKAFVSTLFEQVYRIEEEWDTLHQDISPVLRTRHEAEPRTKKGDAKLETLGHNGQVPDDLPSTPNTNVVCGIPLTPLTPLTPLSYVRSASTTPAALDASSSSKRKRGKRLQCGNMQRNKKIHTSTDQHESKNKENINLTPISNGGALYTRRTLPDSVPYDPNYALLYRRFPISRYLRLDISDSPCSLFNVSHPGGVYNTPRSALDLYTPRFVRGKGVDKLGLCPICIEPLHRGGDNKRVWLAMKFSAYNYHMQYAHGVSSSTGRPFFPPLSVRVVDRSSPKKNEKKTMQEGKCHQCRKWVSMQGVKDVDVKVKELFWWKHAAACHRDAGIVGEQDFYEIDHVWKQLKKLKVV